MEVIEARNGKSWTVREGGRELGIVTISRGGRHGHIFFSAWSAVEDRCRWDLASHVTLEAAVSRVEAFASDPGPFMTTVHRVSVEAVERHR